MVATGLSTVPSHSRSPLLMMDAPMPLVDVGEGRGHLSSEGREHFGHAARRDVIAGTEERRDARRRARLQRVGEKINRHFRAQVRVAQVGERACSCSALTLSMARWAFA